ncbi:MAG TPA: metallophosphoesterase [Gaiellales bacterium]
MAAVTALARVAFAADCGGSGGSKAPKVAAAVNAAFGRFANPAATWLVIGGDEYSVCNASTMKHYDKYLTEPNVSPARTVMTPGNHTNGPGGKSSIPDVSAWLAYNQSKGTLSRTTGGWIDQAGGIPLTDQFVDIAGMRFILLNSGAVENVIDKPGWPVPHTGGAVAGNARVAWLRSAWAKGTKNIVITHHARWSYYGGAHDNPTMQNLVDEIMGKNDGTKPHSSLILQGHDHCMQVMHPQLASGTYPGLTSCVVGLCSTAPTTHAAPKSNTSQLSWLQFANITVGGCGFMQIDIMSDGSLQLSVIDASDTTGKLMTNTSSTGVTGAATATIKTSAT